MNKIELLAPAGSLYKLKIALLYGADAVYIGGEAFSLRVAAENFTMDEIKEGVAFAHNLGKKVYITANIIPHNDEIAQIPQFAKEVAETGADAVLVSDLGMFSLFREYAPSLEIHISTQANNVNWREVQAWKDLGASRVVLARELSLQEIAEIRKKTDAELEVFVHGAMCISYSGRCLLSNYFANRDSNRGACAHPCRWNYALMEEKRPGEYFPVYENERGTFIFNSMDLCMIDHIPELVESGVQSLKIEGRVKTEFYVATVVRAYRQAIDDYYAGRPFNPALYEELAKVSHRHYCTGFFFGRPEQAQNYETSAYIREYDIIGIVKDYDSETKIATIEQRNRFFTGDEIEVLCPDKPFFAQTVVSMQNEAREEIAVAPHAQMTVYMKMEQPVSPNCMLRKKRQEA